MHPIAFHLAGHPVRSAGLLYVLAAIVGGVHAYRVARRNGWDTGVVLPGMALVVAAAYLGARLHGALNHWDRLAADPMRELLRPGALSFFGGLALGSAALIAFLRWVRLPLGEAADALAPVAPILYAMFRLGCFLNGDDYGRPTSMSWGMSFPGGSPPTLDRVHPTQLYEIGLMIPVMLALRWRSRTNRPNGVLAFELCAMMGAERLLVEFSRSGSEASFYPTVPQWLALALGTVGVAGRSWLWIRRTPVT